MRTRVKVCGVTTPEAIEAAVEAGVDALGFVFVPGTPRHLSIIEAASLARFVPPFVAKVAVFRDPSPREVAAVVRTFPADLVQFEVEKRGVLSDAWRARLLPVFHDRETILDQLTCFVSLTGETRPIVHLEGPGQGGRGIPVGLDRAREAASVARLVLAGGLTPDNVGAVIHHVRPFAVDVSSGVESAPGVKDVAKIRAFVAAVRAAEAELASPSSSPRKTP